MNPILGHDTVETFIDGIFTTPRIAHPEGLAFAEDGTLYCGTETGDIIRISPDGTSLEAVANIGGFVLGICLTDGGLFACDLQNSRVVYVDLSDGSWKVFASGGGDRKIGIPNFPVLDIDRGCLYVSDSHDPVEPGPGIWRFDLDSGVGHMWCSEMFRFANGMAMDVDGAALLVVESFAQQLVRIPIGSNGSARAAETVATGLTEVPDGVVVGADGTIFVTCYEPSQIYQISRDGTVQLLVRDPIAHSLCHPTNGAFRGTTLYLANLGRWHIGRVDTGLSGYPLPYGPGAKA